MQDKMVFKYVGKVFIVFSLLLLLPLLIALIYKESVKGFIIPLVVSMSIGLLLQFIKSDNKTLYAKDGFIIVALSWIGISLISAIPFVVIQHIPFIDAFFEAVSGLTTTGATIFGEVENLNKSILFWRSFTHFLGGMGVLTFVMAIIPLSHNTKSMHVLKAEMPGPSVSKLVPSLKKTLFYLYFIYLALTFLEIIFLMIGNLDLFNSILTAFSTAGTGGFASFNSSLANYSLFNKYVVAIFMLLFGVNFNVYFLILMKEFKSSIKSEELRLYFIIFITAVLIIFLNSYHLFKNVFEAFTSIFFHTSSILTSTGFSIGDINIFPTTSRIVLMLLMLISACAGSTCGGFKISRLIIIFKVIKRDFLKVVHPNSVRTITFEGKKVDEDTIKNTSTFMFLYILFIIIIMFIVSFDGYSFEITINAVISTFANVGLCFNISDFSIFSSLSKIVLCCGMLLGRLEIFPLIALFTSLKFRK